MEHSLIMLVYNIKRSINMACLNLIAKLKKWNSYKASLFCLYNNYFRLYKDSIKMSYNLLPKGSRTTILPFMVCMLFMKLSEGGFTA
jgi:hypothetical protein